MYQWSETTIKRNMIIDMRKLLDRFSISYDISKNYDQINFNMNNKLIYLKISAIRGLIWEYSVIDNKIDYISHFNIRYIVEYLCCVLREILCSNKYIFNFPDQVIDPIFQQIIKYFNNINHNNYILRYLRSCGIDCELVGSCIIGNGKFNKINPIKLNGSPQSVLLLLNGGLLLNEHFKINNEVIEILFREKDKCLQVMMISKYLLENDLVEDVINIILIDIFNLFFGPQCIYF